MSDTVIVAMIAALPGALAGIAAVVLALRNSSKLRDVHELVNGMAHSRDELTDSSARAQGELAGRDFERRRSTDVSDSS